MAAFPLRTAWLTGPLLIRRAPLAFAVWVLLAIAGQYASLTVELAVRSAGGGPAQIAVSAALVGLPVQAVLIAAVLRGCLGLGAPRLAFLRLGLTEAKMTGLILLAGLAGMLIALPAAMAASYAAYFLRQTLLAGSVLGIGAAVSALVLMRLAPLPVGLVAGGRLDIAAALRASRGRYLPLTGSILAAAVLERLVQDAAHGLLHPPRAATWSALASPVTLAVVAWDSLIAVAALAFMGGVVCAVWRDDRQTRD